MTDATIPFLMKKYPHSRPGLARDHLHDTPCSGAHILHGVPSQYSKPKFILLTNSVSAMSRTRKHTHSHRHTCMYLSLSHTHTQAPTNPLFYSSTSTESRCSFVEHKNHYSFMTTNSSGNAYHRSRLLLLAAPVTEARIEQT